MISQYMCVERIWFVSVLLAPYGMSGSLTGRSFAESDQRAQKMLDDWKRFFCFPKAENQGGLEEGKELPAAVEVIVGRNRVVTVSIKQTLVKLLGSVVAKIAFVFCVLLFSVVGSLCLAAIGSQV